MTIIGADLTSWEADLGSLAPERGLKGLKVGEIGRNLVKFWLFLPFFHLFDPKNQLEISGWGFRDPGRPETWDFPGFRTIV